MITEINKDNFEKSITFGEARRCRFWAPWCGYCRRLAPAIDRLESEYGDKLKFVKIEHGRQRRSRTNTAWIPFLP
ncbi:MAG: thioredoxin family protein [Christensenellaceae bacterium]